MVTKEVLVPLEKVALKFLLVFDFKSFTDLFSFLYHDTKWFWVLQLGDVLNRGKEKVFVSENRFSRVSGCFVLKIVNFTAVMDVTFLHLSAKYIPKYIFIYA